MYVSIPVLLKVQECDYCGPSCMAQWVPVGPVGMCVQLTMEDKVELEVTVLGG